MRSVRSASKNGTHLKAWIVGCRDWVDLCNVDDESESMREASLGRRFR